VNKHTPGPWVVTHCGDEFGGWMLLNEKGQQIGPNFDSEQDAWAYVAGLHPAMGAFGFRARAAIAKATGGES